MLRSLHPVTIGLVLVGVVIAATAVAAGWSPLVFYAAIVLAGVGTLPSLERHDQRHGHR